MAGNHRKASLINTKSCIMRLFYIRSIALLVFTGAVFLSLYAFTNRQQDVSSVKEEAFFAFAKAYGYIRYFYPGDESSAVDWDRFAWHGVNQISTTKESTQQQLTALFSPIGSPITFSRLGTAVTSPQLLSDTSNMIFWQHIGDGKESIGHPYKSMRINRPARKLPESPNDFGSIKKNLSVNTYAGKKIKFTAKLRIDASFNGSAYLVLALKQPGKDRKTFNTKGQNLAIGEWVSHEIIADVPDSLEQCLIAVEPILLTGSVMAADLEVSYQKNDQWVVADRFGFTNITNAQLTTEWKPFGPNQDIDITSQDNHKVVRFSRTKGVLQAVSPLFRITVPEQQYLTRGIGAGLQIGFPLVMAQKDQHTIPAVPASLLVSLQQHLNMISDTDLNAISLNTRIANVIILWNRLQHFHPDNPFSSVEWEQELKKAIRKSLADQHIDEHRETLTTMIRGLNDSHTTLYYSAIARPDFYLPVQWGLVEGKLVITKILDAGTDLKAGDLIETVNGLPASQYWNNIISSTIGATASRKAYKAVEESICGEENSTVTISVKKENQQAKTYQLKRTLSEFAYNKAMSANVSTQKFKQLTAGITYINLHQISWDELQTHLTELSVAKGIIFDMRGYPKWGNIEILAHLSKQTIYGMTYALPHITYPDRKHIVYAKETPAEYQARQPFFPGKAVFLTNGSALSYAEDLMELVKFYRLGTIVGESTAGTTGTINMCYLFGGLFTPWTGMRVLRQDGSSYNGEGVQPDKWVSPSIKGVQLEEDELMAYALRLLQPSSN